MNRPLTGAYRPYLASYGQGAQSFNQIFDTGWVTYTTDGASIIGTGAWRPMFPSDLASTVGSIYLSGINVNTDQLETIETSGVRSVTSNFSIITGSQIVIPVGSRSWSVAFISGDAGYINGTGTFQAGLSLSSANYNLNAIVIGGTGSTGAPFKAIVQWEV